MKPLAAIVPPLIARMCCRIWGEQEECVRLRRENSYSTHFFLNPCSSCILINTVILIEDVCFHLNGMCRGKHKTKKGCNGDDKYMTGINVFVIFKANQSYLWCVKNMYQYLCRHCFFKRNTLILFIADFSLCLNVNCKLWLNE